MQITIKAQPMSRANIKSIAVNLRKAFQISSHYFPIDSILEFIHLLAPGYSYEVMKIEDIYKPIEIIVVKKGDF